MSEPCTLVAHNGLPDYCEQHRRYHHGHHRKWALGTDEISIAKREQWTKLAENIPIEPERKRTVPFTAAQMLVSYAETLKEHIAGGRVMVPLEVWQERRDKCNACEYHDKKNDACYVCRCKLSPSLLEALIIGDKLKWAVSKCPLPEPVWNKYVAPSSE